MLHNLFLCLRIHGCAEKLLNILSLKSGCEKFDGSAIEEWLQKLITLRRELKGLNRNVDAWYRKNKAKLVGKLDI